MRAIPLRTAAVCAPVVICLLLGTAFAELRASTVAADGSSIQFVAKGPECRPVSFVLLGATGNLAKKYLWQSLFDIWAATETECPAFMVFAAARSPTVEGHHAVTAIVNSGAVKCHGTTPLDECNIAKSFFLQTVQYVQLKDAPSYENLQGLIARVNPHEAGRLFYLSIAPSVFLQAVQYISAAVRPAAIGVWLRVVIEKPVGSDAASCAELIAGLSRSLAAEEMLFVDHYLGKDAMRMIPLFRASALWWMKHTLGTAADAAPALACPARVAVVMAETEDVQGRTGFYEGVGVIRDVLQNHASEMLAHALADVEIPTDHGAVPVVPPAARTRLLAGLTPCSTASGLAHTSWRQYDSYRAHLLADLTAENARFHGAKTAADIAREADRSRTATAASVCFEAATGWDACVNKPTPIVTFAAGKALQAREAYVSVAYDNNVTVTYMLHGDAVLPTSQVEAADVASQHSGLQRLISAASLGRNASLPGKRGGAWTVIKGVNPGSLVGSVHIGKVGAVLITGVPMQRLHNVSFPADWQVLRHSGSEAVLVFPTLPEDAGASGGGGGVHVKRSMLTPGSAGAYSSLLIAAANNDASSFVGVDEVTALWAMWQELLVHADAATHMDTYAHGDSTWLHV